MGMVTYDGLNGASAQSKTDRLTVWKVPCLSRQSIVGQIIAGTSLEGSMFVQAEYCGSDRRWYMYIHLRSSSGLFHVHINAKAPINPGR